VDRIRYELRAATRADHEGLLELAGFLNTVNLPHDAESVRAIVDEAEKSFSGATTDVRRRKYVFVLRDLQEGRTIGTSMVLGQLGRKDAPYIYLDVRTSEKYCEELDRYFAHRLLQIGYSFDGPTEIGGLIMHPDYRQSRERLGVVISYVRFLWIAMHRGWFRDRLLAELLPPLEADGTSHLWEGLGRRFTGLSYREADLLSHQSKTFISNLFPDGVIYASLLSPEAQSVIGKVGAQTRGVEKMLRRVGFRYAERVDPFDGGPHFVAETDEVLPVKESRERRVEIAKVETSQRMIIAVEHKEAPWFHAVVGEGGAPDEATVALSPAIAAHLKVSSGSTVWVLPL